MAQGSRNAIGTGFLLQTSETPRKVPVYTFYTSTLCRQRKTMTLTQSSGGQHQGGPPLLSLIPVCHAIAEQVS
jgi:hypothetical protein